MQQYGLGLTGLAAERMHAAVMAIVEPELERTALARSSIAALRATVADLQELVRSLALPTPAAEWLRNMPVADRQAMNRELAVAIAGAGNMLAAIEGLGDGLLPWLAARIEAGNNEPNFRLAA